MGGGVSGDEAGAVTRGDRGGRGLGGQGHGVVLGQLLVPRLGGPPVLGGLLLHLVAELVAGTGVLAMGTGTRIWKGRRDVFSRRKFFRSERDIFGKGSAVAQKGRNGPIRGYLNFVMFCFQVLGPISVKFLKEVKF